MKFNYTILNTNELYLLPGYPKNGEQIKFLSFQGP